MIGTRIVAKRTDKSTITRNRPHFKKFHCQLEHNNDHEYGYDNHENSSEDELTDDKFGCEPNIPQLLQHYRHHQQLSPRNVILRDNVLDCGITWNSNFVPLRQTFTKTLDKYEL